MSYKNKVKRQGDAAGAAGGQAGQQPADPRLKK